MEDLIQLLKEKPRDNNILELILAAEANSDVDLNRDLKLLTGVWEMGRGLRLCDAP